MLTWVLASMVSIVGGGGLYRPQPVCIIMRTEQTNAHMGAFNREHCGYVMVACTALSLIMRTTNQCSWAQARAGGLYK